MGFHEARAASECLSVSCRAQACSGLPSSRRLCCSTPARYSVWHKSTGRRAPLPRQSQGRAAHRLEDDGVREALALPQSPGPQQAPHPGDQATGWTAPRESDFDSPWHLITELPQDWGTDSWRAQTKPCAHKDPEKGAVTPQETEPDLPVSVQESPTEAWVDNGLP